LRQFISVSWHSILTYYYPRKWLILRLFCVNSKVGTPSTVIVTPDANTWTCGSLEALALDGGFDAVRCSIATDYATRLCKCTGPPIPAPPFISEPPCSFCDKFAQIINKDKLVQTEGLGPITCDDLIFAANNAYIPAPLCNFMQKFDQAKIQATCCSVPSLGKPPGSGGVAPCFPGSSMVNVEHVGLVPLSKVQLGDSIQVAPGVYEPIYSFGHYSPTGTNYEYVQIETEDKTLEVSDKHMVFVQNDVTKSVPASAIEVGDLLLDQDLKPTTVRRVKAVTREGALAPFTPSGKLMVDGILVSSYVAMTSGSFNQWLAHTYQFPHRCVCLYFGRCMTEKYTSEGLSTWIAAPYEMSQWIIESRYAMVWFALILPVLCVFQMMEFFLLHPSLTGVLFALMLLVRFFASASKKAKLA
jgi:hypothetical protein